MSYPAWDYNRGAQLLAQLGSFWAEIFDDRDRVQSHLESSAHEQYQTYLNFVETVACVSRLNIPVFHKEMWKLVVFKKSEVESITSIYEPDDLVYGPQTGLRPLRPAGWTQVYGGVDNPFYTQAPLPEGLAKADFIMQNKVLSPSRTYTNGIDFDIDRERKLIRFRSDLFSDVLVPHRNVYDADGNLLDEEVSLWLYQGEWDLQYVYTQFGYAIGLKLDSSQFYKDLLNAFWDAHVLGPGVREIKAMLAAAAGAPTILESQETVELIRTEPDRKLVVTDQHVYSVPVAANVVVTAGETLYAGDVISDAIDLFEVSGSAPDYSALPQITLGKELLSGDYFSGLTFKNTTMPLVYEGLDADGKAVVSFTIYGYPADISEFWASSLARGKETGNKTLAELLDERTAPVGQPVASDLPATVNPMQFCFQNFFGNNLFIIKARQAAFGDDAPGLTYFYLLREVLPPHTAFILFVELNPDRDSIDLATAVDDPSGLIVGTMSDSISGIQDVCVDAHYVAWNCV